MERELSAKMARQANHYAILYKAAKAAIEQLKGRCIGDDEGRDDQGRVLAGEMIGDPSGHVPDGMTVVKCGYCHRFYTKEIGAPNDCIGCGSPY